MQDTKRQSAGSSKGEKRNQMRASFQTAHNHHSEDNPDCLVLADFQEMDPAFERPALVVHVIKTLTGLDISGHQDRIVEEKEPPKMIPFQA